MAVVADTCGEVVAVEEISCKNVVVVVVVVT